MKSQQGFTLIEIIVSLMLVSILAVAAGFGIVEVAKSYQFAKENAVMAQKAHIALQRISLELMDLSSVTTANATNVVIKASNAPSSSNDRSIGLYGSDIRFDDDTNAANGEILINNVSDFQVVYNDLNDQPWNTAMPTDQLFGIDVSLTLSRGDGIAPINFTTQVNPRNNRTLNAPS